jgi:hypothetical protein
MIWGSSLSVCGGFHFPRQTLRSAGIDDILMVLPE